MLELTFGGSRERLRTLLAIGCHSDDIEIGAGGTILTLTRAIPDLAVHWVVLAASGRREEEARASAEAFLSSAGTARVTVHGFRDGFLPYEGAQVKEAFEEMKEAVEPQLVLTHRADDYHQDHRLACELTWNTFRRHTILEYEIPKVDGDLGRPNVFVRLTEEVALEKVDLLDRLFGSQRSKHWFDRTRSSGSCA